MITVHQLSKHYGDCVALNNISFRADRGQVVGLLGLNGAGKTTCLRVLSGYLMPSGGSCSIGDTDVFSDPIQAKAKIGYLSETPPLYPELTVKSYLLFVARMRGLASDAFADQWQKVSGLTHLQEVGDTLIRHLSLGYRKRVGIAQALIGLPSVLIFDEPVTGLDPVQIVEMRKLIRSLAGKYTLLISSHILTEISQTCDKVVVLHKGQVAAEIEGEELQSNAGQSLEKKFIELTTR